MWCGGRKKKKRNELWLLSLVTEGRVQEREKGGDGRDWRSTKRGGGGGGGR